MGTGVCCRKMSDNVKGFLAENKDGSFTVIINSKMDIEQQSNAYFYAMERIKLSKLKKCL